MKFPKRIDFKWPHYTHTYTCTHTTLWGDVLINLIVIIISQYIHISKYYIVHHMIFTCQLFLDKAGKNYWAPDPELLCCKSILCMCKVSSVTLCRPTGFGGQKSKTNLPTLVIAFAVANDVFCLCCGYLLPSVTSYTLWLSCYLTSEVKCHNLLSWWYSLLLSWQTCSVCSLCKWMRALFILQRRKFLKYLRIIEVHCRI